MGFEDEMFWAAKDFKDEKEAWKAHALDLERRLANNSGSNPSTKRLALQLAGVLAMADLLARSLADAGDPDNLLTPQDGIVEIWGPEPGLVGIQGSGSGENKSLSFARFHPKLALGSQVKPGDVLFHLAGDHMLTKTVPVVSHAEGELIFVVEEGPITKSQPVARIRGRAAGVRPFMVKPQGVLGEAFLAAMRLRSQSMGVDNPDAFAIWPRTQAKEGDSVSPVVDESYAKLRKNGQPFALEYILKVERAHSAGLMAQAGKLRDLVANSGDPTGILAPSGEFRRDNNLPKTMLSTVYDEAFDQKAREQGIEKPELLRQ